MNMGGGRIDAEGKTLTTEGKTLTKPGICVAREK